MEKGMKNGKKILIVDDDDFLLDLYAIKFKEAGFLVDIAKNGEEAIERVKQSSPDIMLLDVVMPKMDGFEVLRIMKEQNIVPHTHIVLLSNLGQKEDIDRGLKLGARDYIIKAQFTPSEVVAKVKSFL